MLALLLAATLSVSDLTVVSVYTCPPCPKGAMCKPCAPESVALKDEAGARRTALTDRAASYKAGRKYRLVLKEGDPRGEVMLPPAAVLVAREARGGFELEDLSALNGPLPEGRYLVDARIARVFACPPCPPGKACERCQAARVYLEDPAREWRKGELLLGAFEPRAAALEPGKVYRLWVKGGVAPTLEDARRR